MLVRGGSICFIVMNTFLHVPLITRNAHSTLTLLDFAILVELVCENCDDRHGLRVDALFSKLIKGVSEFALSL